MKRHLALALCGAVALGTVAAGPNEASQAAIDHEFELELGDAASDVGSQPVGINVENYVGDGYSCDGAPNHTCGIALVKVTNPYEEENAKKGRERATLNVVVTPDFAGSDYDVLVFESDADGNQGAEVGSAGGVPVTDHPESVESVSVVVTTTEEETERYFLVWIVHWATVGSYTIDVDFAQ